MMLSEKPRSPVSEHRKVTKSAMEKKRRARINSSLTELKTILAGIMSHKDEKFEKMEKADILEMTVNYVRELQNKASMKDKHIHQDGDNYRSGVSSCISEVIRYVTASGICDTDTKTKLLDHLANRVNNISTTPQAACVNSPNNKDVVLTTSVVNVDETITDVNNNVNNVYKPDNDERLQPITIYTNPFPVNSTQPNIQTSPNVIPISPLPTTNTYNRTQDTQHIKQVSQTHTLVNPDVSMNKPQIFPIISHTQPQVVSNIPLTIFVPANFCTNAAGTTCVIPITLANPRPDSGIVSSSTNNDPIGNAKTCSIVNNKDETEGVCEMITSQTNFDSDVSDNFTETTKEGDIENVYRIEPQSGCNDITKCTTSLSNNKSISQSDTVFRTPNSVFSAKHVIRRKSVHQFNRQNSVWRPW